MWAKVQDGVVVAYPYGLSELRRDRPETSFPDSMPDERLAEFGIVPVIPQDPPWHDYLTQHCTRVWPTRSDAGWVETWVVANSSPEDVATRTAETAASIRAERNYKLAQTDWTQLADAPVDREAWASYRQQLRDLTSVPGFPDNVTWPSTP